MNPLKSSYKHHFSTLWYYIIVVVAMSLSTLPAHADATALKHQLQSAISQYDATVGIAIITDGGDTITINNDTHYPLMSVMKLHQAVYVAHYMDRHDMDVNHMVTIEKEDLKTGTYSPLRDRYPEGGISVTIGQLLEYTLQLSDNNACDILFALTGGPAATDNYMRSIGLSAFAISATEDDMHRNPASCHDNYTTPIEAARLIDMLYRGQLPPSRNLQFVEQTLLNCHTGLQRIPRALSEGDTIAHKTGTSDQDANGRWTAINDLAHISTSDGHSYSIAVFVKDSGESFETTERIIAQVAQIVSSYMHRQ